MGAAASIERCKYMFALAGMMRETADHQHQSHRQAAIPQPISYIAKELFQHFITSFVVLALDMVQQMDVQWPKLSNCTDR